MNHIFKTIWSRTHNCYVVVDETKGSFGKTTKSVKKNSAGKHHAVNKTILASLTKRPGIP